VRDHAWRAIGTSWLLCALELSACSVNVLESEPEVTDAGQYPADPDAGHRLDANVQDRPEGGISFPRADAGLGDASRADAGGRDGSTADASEAGTTSDANALDAAPPECSGDSMRVCGGACVDVLTTDSHCGECGHDCGGSGCTEGTCQPLTLASGLYYPNAIAASPDAVYYSDGANDAIYRLATHGGTAPTLFASGFARVGKLQVAGDRLLFQEGGNVFSTPLSSYAPSMVLAGPTCWTADSTSLYASYASSACTCLQEHVEPSSMPPYLDVTTLVPGFCSPDDLFVDHQCRSECTCATAGRIQRSAMDGTNAQLLHSGYVSGQPNDCLAVSASALFFSARVKGSNCGSSASPYPQQDLLRIPLDGSAIRSLITLKADSSLHSQVYTAGNHVFFSHGQMGTCSNVSPGGWSRMLGTGGAREAGSTSSYFVRAAALVRDVHYVLRWNTGGILMRIPVASPLAATQILVGVNGLASVGDYLYLSDSANGSIVRLAP
jgi:hypothetical protein